MSMTVHSPIEANLKFKFYLCGPQPSNTRIKETRGRVPDPDTERNRIGIWMYLKDKKQGTRLRGKKNTGVIFSASSGPTLGLRKRDFLSGEKKPEWLISERGEGLKYKQ